MDFVKQFSFPFSVGVVLSRQVDHLRSVEAFVERVIIEKECCKGCELCIRACPRSVLVMSDDFNKSGYHYSVFKNKEDCNSCTFCAVICPDVCIEVYR